MDAAVSERLKEAVDFLVANGYERSDAALARRIGVAYSTLCMAKRGTRAPTWAMLLDLCDAYPINFWWLRSGEGEMTGGRFRRELALMKRIERLEGRIRELEGKE